MEREGKRVWFPYGAAEYRAAQAALDRLGREGWRLTGIRLGFARFVREEAPVAYAAAMTTGGDERADYLALCAEAGWTLAAARDGVDVFTARPGVRPVPLETDPEVERQAAGRAFFGGMLVCGILLALGAAAFLARGGWDHLLPLEVWKDNGDLAQAAVGVLCAAVLLVEAVWSATLWRRCRRGGLPPDRMRAPRLRWLLNGLLSLLVLAAFGLGLAGALGAWRMECTTDPAALAALPVVRAPDLGLDGGGSDGGLADYGGSVLLDCVEYRERLEDGVLYCDRWEGRCPWVAAQAARALLWEEAHGGRDLAPAELGFDSAWLAQGPLYDVLVLQQGNITARIEAPADLTDPEVLAAVVSRLGLEGGSDGTGEEAYLVPLPERGLQGGGGAAQ